MIYAFISSPVYSTSILIPHQELQLYISYIELSESIIIKVVNNPFIIRIIKKPLNYIYIMRFSELGVKQYKISAFLYEISEK